MNNDFLDQIQCDELTPEPTAQDWAEANEYFESIGWPDGEDVEDSDWREGFQNLDRDRPW